MDEPGLHQPKQHFKSNGRQVVLVPHHYCYCCVQMQVNAVSAGRASVHHGLLLSELEAAAHVDPHAQAWVSGTVTTGQSFGDKIEVS